MPKIISKKSNVDLDYPICRPSLDLDFTQEELDPRITFSRGSIGTRVNRNRLIETVAVNQPRFDYDPVTGECKGLLIEESRQNLLLQSNGFDTASWSKYSVTLIPNSITSPDGTTNAYKQVENATSGLHRNNQTIGKSAVATTYTFSVFVKSGERNGLEFGILDSGGYVDCFANSTTGVFAGAPTINGAFVLGSYGSIAYPNGWYRFYVTAITTAQTGVTAFIGTTRSVAQVNNYQGDGTSGIYVWGAQVETGAFPTSYIPTSGSTVTRSAEIAEMTGTNFSSWYNSTEGTLYARWSIPVKPSGFPGIANIQDSGRNNGVIISTNLNNNNRVTVRGSNLTIIDDYTNLTIPLNSVAGSAIAYRTNSTTTDAFYSGNGGNESSRSVTKNIPIVNVDRLLLGNNVGNILSGHIRRVTYYPRALKPNQLQLLTQ